jgi:hypothetical protein
MFGDILRKKVSMLQYASENKFATDAFWIILRDIAREDIIASIEPVDSDIAVPIYYEILCDNLDFIPAYFQQTLRSNDQERFRVINRNLFTSNAFHPDGLANQEGISAKKEINEDKKGERIIYWREQ